VDKVDPDTDVVSLFATVSDEHATTSQVNTFDHPDTPGRDSKQVTVKLVPALDV
jgi:hypothetical protein